MVYNQGKIPFPTTSKPNRKDGFMTAVTWELLQYGEFPQNYKHRISATRSILLAVPENLGLSFIRMSLKLVEL